VSRLETAVFKITDFGFARELEKDELLRGCFGTINYMSPEVQRQEKYN